MYGTFPPGDINCDMIQREALIQRTSDGEDASKRSAEASIAIQPAPQTAGALRQRRMDGHCGVKEDYSCVMKKAHDTFTSLSSDMRS